MTLTDLLRILRKWWLIVLVGLLATTATAVFATRATPVYHARTEVVFLAPPSIRYPNELVTTTESLIVTAGVVAKRINGADSRIKFGSAITTPVGAPDDGRTIWINLLDTGTQWVSIFDDQILVVDAIGASPSEVSQRIEDASALISEQLHELQTQMNVGSVNEIKTRMSPPAPVVEEVTGSRARAFGMTLAVGGFLTVGLVVVLEVRSRSTRPRASSSLRAL